METKNVKMSIIYADFDFNSRKRVEGISALAEDMGTNGQLVPLIVTKATIDKDNKGKGKHLLLAGYRRFLAAERLKWDEITVQYLDAVPYSKEAALVNCRENFSRHDLTTFDTARALCTLSSIHKMKYDELAVAFKSSINLGAKQINSLINAQNRLHADILTAWQDQHKVATTTNLFALAAFKDQEEQLVRWNALVESKGLTADAAESARLLEERAKARAEENKARRAAGETVKIHKPSGDLRAKVLGLVRASELSAEAKQAASAVLLWIEGTPEDLIIGKTLVFSLGAEKEQSKAGKAENAAKIAAALASKKQAKGMAAGFLALPAAVRDQALAALPPDVQEGVKQAMAEIVATAAKTEGEKAKK